MEIVEKFSRGILNSGIFKLYVAIGFFGILIFFVLNSFWFSPLEIMTGIVCAAAILKGISNIMLALMINFFNLDNIKEELEFKHNTDHIDSLLTDLTVQEQAVT